MTARMHLMIVGAFPLKGSPIVGGIATSCRVLLQSSLPARAQLTLFDSSQVSNPPPGLLERGARAAVRLVRFVARFESARPQALILFTAPGASTVEKGVMAWYARLRRCAVLLMPRGAPPADHQAMARYRAFRVLAFKGATCIVCQGQAWHDFAVSRLGFAVQHAPILPNWTATPELLAIGRARTPPPTDKVVSLLYLGWVERQKGILDLLRACEQLKDDLEFRLDIVGGGHALGEVQAWIDRHGMAHRVTCHGWLHGDAKLDRLRQADVFALPSWAEGLPNAMIEAMACRIACVVTAVGNIPSVIGTSGAAAVVPARDTAALAEALRCVVSDRGLRERLAEAGLAFAEQQFDAERAMDRLLTIARAAITTVSHA